MSNEREKFEEKKRKEQVQNKKNTLLKAVGAAASIALVVIGVNSAKNS